MMPRTIACLLAVALTLLGGTARAAEPTFLASGDQWRPSSAIEGAGLNGVVRLRGELRQVTIGPATIVNAYRAVESDEGSRVTGLRIRGLRASNLQRDGIRLRHGTDVEIADFAFSFRAEPQRLRHLPEGIAIYAGSNITIRDGVLRGFRTQVPEGQYENGDGIATEKAVDGLRILRVTASDNSDAGFDLKGRNIVLDNLTAIGNGRSYRFWGEARAGLLTSIDGRDAVWAAKGAEVVIERLVARSAKPARVVVTDGPDARVTIRSCDLSRMARGSTLVERAPGSTVTLGAGCQLAP
jgi:hypothetical protein